MVFTLIMLSLLLTPVYSQNASINLEQKILVEKNGGNLYIVYRVDIYGDNPGQVTFSFPKSFIDSTKYVYVDAYQYKENPLSTRISYTNNSVSITVDTSVLNEEDGKYPFTLIIYVPNHVYQRSPGQYRLKIVSYPATNIPINYTMFEIDFPFDTKPVNSPPNTNIIKVSPTGAPQDQYKIEGEFTGEDIQYEDYGLPTLYEITIRPTKAMAPPILLLRGNASLVIELLPNGLARYLFKYDFLNLGKDALAGLTRLELRNIPGSSSVVAKTSLDRVLETLVLGDQVRVPVPYITKPGEIIQLRVEYTVRGSSILRGFLGNELYYNISFKMPSEYFIENLNVSIFGPYGEMVYNDVIYNVTKFNEIVLDGSVSNNVFAVLGQEPTIGVSIFIIALVGISYSIYSFISYYAVGRLPPELTKYMEKVSRFIRTMNELIVLEDKYLSREIRSKEYVSRRNELLRRLKIELREASESGNILKKVSSGNPVIERELALVGDVISRWEDLRKLENEFKARKIGPQEYGEKRRQLLMDFKALVAKISL